MQHLRTALTNLSMMSFRAGSPLAGHTLVVKTPAGTKFTQSDRLALSSYFDDAASMNSIQTLETNTGACGKPTKEDAAFFRSLDVLFASGGAEKVRPRAAK